jgi:hypothetical protein
MKTIIASRNYVLAFFRRLVPCKKADDIQKGIAFAD